MEFEKMYWVEDAYLWEPGGFDYVCIGRITNKDQLAKDGENWCGSHDGYEFHCFETLEQALNSLTIRPSALRCDESLIEDDMKAIKDFVRSHESGWIARNYATDVKDVVTPIYDRNDFATYHIALSKKQNEEVQSCCDDNKPIVRVDFDKKDESLKLLKLTQDGVFEPIHECNSYYEDLVTFACNSVYKYCNLYEDMDIRNFYTDKIKNACIDKIEEMER